MKIALVCGLNGAVFNEHLKDAAFNNDSHGMVMFSSNDVIAIELLDTDTEEMWTGVEAIAEMIKVIRAETAEVIIKQAREAATLGVASGNPVVADSKQLV